MGLKDSWCSSAKPGASPKAMGASVVLFMHHGLSLSLRSASTYLEKVRERDIHLLCVVTHEDEVGAERHKQEVGQPCQHADDDGGPLAVALVAFELAVVCIETCMGGWLVCGAIT